MAFRDGMAAIAKVLKVAAIAVSGLCLIVMIWQGLFLEGLPASIMVFLLLWTPAWIIRKFIQ